MLQGLPFDRYRSFVYMVSFLLLLCSFTATTVSAQSSSGIITGTVKDGSTNTLLPGVNITRDSTKTQGLSRADGKYILSMIDGPHTLYFICPGYQTKVIQKVDILPSRIIHLDIVLFPVATGKKYSSIRRDIDSVNTESRTELLDKEKNNIIYNPLNKFNTLTDVISNRLIQPGTDKNAAWLLSRVNGVIVRNDWQSPGLQSLQVAGLGERYNQLILNGAVMNSSDPLTNNYPLALLPAETVEEVRLYKTGNSFLPGGYTGGTVEIKTKDIPEKNFFLVQVGVGYTDNTIGKDFLGDQKSDWQFAAFPGSVRYLPSAFPTSRSQSGFSQKNLQERVFLSKQLNNNLEPVKYDKALPDDRVLLGFGKTLHLKKDLTIGIIALVNHIKEQMVEASSVQVSPNVRDNPFPFSDPSKVVIRSQSSDVNYRYSSQLGGMLNVSFYFRKNKISIRNYLGSQYQNTLSVRNNMFKPDEDTLSHYGLRYLADQRKFWNAQVAGEHLLGANSKFVIKWQATYNYNNRKMPDERNFLLQQDSTNKSLYRIARPLSAPFDPTIPTTYASNFTNTSRLWREYTENNFTASLDLKMPVNLLHHPQVLNGGLYMQSASREFRSDLLLVNSGDTSFSTMNNIIAPGRYYPGGLGVTNYFSNFNRANTDPTIQDIHRGNYFAASNIASSYIYLDTRFLSVIFFRFGARLESSNQSSTTVQYEYIPGYRNPQKFSINDNSRQVYFNLLPSANLTYKPIQSVEIGGSYARTINRPMLQEMNAYKYYDVSSFMVRSGNPFLSNALIDNYSAGVKWMVNAGAHISVNGFYKEIDQPIEDVVSLYSTGNMLVAPYNMPAATVKGVTADFRLRLDVFADLQWLSNVSLFGSGTVLKSEVSAGPLRSSSIATTEAHTLSGSPDYTFNGGITIQDPRFPELSVIYNQTADYISKVGSGAVIKLVNGNKITAVPDYRIKGRGRLDIQLAQKFFREKIQVIAGAINLVNAPIIEYQDLNGNKKSDTPLVITNGTGSYGFYTSGTDNTIVNIKSQRAYYVRLSYTF